MSPISAGERAPAIPGVDLEPGPSMVMFYKVTCPTCQLAAPVAQRLFERFPGRFAGVAQDPPESVEEFGRRFGASFPSVSDAPPYPGSDAFGIRTVPTLFVVDDGRVADVVESWDRAGWNRVTALLDELLGSGSGAPISEAGDGLPPMRPG